MKVLIVIITRDRVRPECWEAALAQDHDEVDILLHRRKPRFASANTIVTKYVNCAENRETARRIALTSEAERFLFVDDDVVIPTHAVSEFLKQPFDVQGGYYLVAGDSRYTCGRWVDETLFLNLRAVEPSLVRVDCIGMGCAMFSRKALEAIRFDHGTDEIAETVINGNRVPMIVGECGRVGELLGGLGYAMYMNGSVVCEHLGDPRWADRQRPHLIATE